MSKNIVLLALLLPFSGSAITKEERKQQIQMKSLECCIENLIELYAFIMQLPCVQISIAALPKEKLEEFRKMQHDFYLQQEVLEKEYIELEQV